MDDDAARRKLGGYLRAVLSLPAGADATSLHPLSPCSLSACGSVPLAPLPDDGPHPRSKWRACSGGGSVVRQLRALVAHRCVEVEGRVLRVVTRSGEGDREVEARAVVLVDVYLPVAAWSGWQFPRSRAAAAAAVFKHVRCVCIPCVSCVRCSVPRRIVLSRSSSPDLGRHVPALLRQILELGGFWDRILLFDLSILGYGNCDP